MEKKVIHINGMSVTGPYSQSIEPRGLIFVSGIGPVKKDDGAIELGDIKNSTEIVLSNIEKCVRLK